VSENGVILKVRDLTKHFPIMRGVLIKRPVGYVRAVDGISFDVYEGETLGLVGESGSGKSTTGRVILQLYRPTSGTVEFEGRQLDELKGRDLQAMRPKMQMIFQDPYASLNPRMTVGDLIGEPLLIHTNMSHKERAWRVGELLKTVGLNPVFAQRYPHEFSGGQRQRIGVARALAVNPDFIICDEPISALDVSVQAQVVNLLEDLQDKLGLTYLFIAHDLSMVRHIANRVAVMYLGKLMELADQEEIYTSPLHPYTQALLSAVPIPDPKVEMTRKRIILEGDVPSPVNPPSGCVFHNRCPLAVEVCKNVVPEWKQVSRGHWVHCHLV